ncbi:MAG TPA: FAD:protein FMN transferase [Solirubrobacteraceae bacterium]|nr:FAD:protein FMN transferase [Solirubrobacteraceae bacterium]
MSDESTTRFACFGGNCAVLVSGRGPDGDAAQATARARARMLEWHDRFTRFDESSELSVLNRDPREAVPASPTLRALVRAAVHAARLTGGLVDPTLLGELEAAGYRRSLGALGGPTGVELRRALGAAPERRPATPRPDARWRDIRIDDRAGTITRPPGLRIDLGGVAKGMFGDLLASTLAEHDSFAVDAAGDVRFGGRNTLPRPIAIAAPAGEAVLHTLELQHGAAATSGIGRRAWSDAEGRPGHHLLDPATGRPAFTGLVQVTALAPTGLEAELRAKAALLSGPARAAEWLPDGGATIDDDGVVTVLAPSAALRAPARVRIRA